MNSESEKGIYEIEIFKAFCSKLPNTEVTDVAKCIPPKPDLVCNFAGQITYFELARNYSKEFAQQHFDPLAHDNVFGGEDATKRILHAKLDKTYLVKEPIHLLLYDDLGMSCANHLVIQIIENILASREEIQFDKIWYFAEDKVVQVYSVN